MRGVLFDFPLETLGEEMRSWIEKRSIEPDELPCQINMMSSTTAEEAAEFFSEPDPDLIASALFQKLKLDFLVAVEKIRREAEITKIRSQQSSHPPFPHTEGQQSCAIVPNSSGNSPSISLQSSIPEAEFHSRTFPAVSTSLTTIQTTAGKAATSVATSQIYESKASTDASKPIGPDNAATRSTPLDGSRVEFPDFCLDWRTGGSNFGGQMPTMENQGLPLSMDSKFSVGVSDDIFSTICDLESRPNLTFSRKGRGERIETSSTSCKVPRLSPAAAAVHSDGGEFSHGSQSYITGEGSGTSESEDLPAGSKSKPHVVKCKRYKRTHEALQSSGLLDVTMKTAELMKRNRQLQKDIKDFKKETVEFLKSVLQNPENKEYAKVIHGKSTSTPGSRDTPTV